MINNSISLLHEICEKYPNKLDKATAFVWVHYKINEGGICESKDINQYFEQLNLSKYNVTYLKKDLSKSRNVISGGKPNTYKPSRDYILKMETDFNHLLIKSEEIESFDSIIPQSLYKDTRGYIINLSNQINASYENNIFDGCAVLMRRLLEILLIHSYETVGKIHIIQENEGYKNLSFIINDVLQNKNLSISKDIQTVLDKFRMLGNLSAHRIQYNAKKTYIDEIKMLYRVAIEELLYLSQIKK